MIRPVGGAGILERGFAFWLLGYPVTVKNAFWLVTVLFALQRSRSPGLCLEWLLVVTLALLIHELGHAWMGRRFGLDPVIVLHGMGGLTQFLRSAGRLRWQQEVAVSVAGPGAGFLSGALVWVLTRDIDRSVPYLARVAAWDLTVVSLVWGIFNLLPMLPLDGGNVLAVLLRRYGRDWRMAHRVSLGTAIVLGALAISLNETWVAVLAALFGLQNWQALKGVTLRFW